MTLTDWLALVSTGSLGTLILGVLKYRSDLRAAATAHAEALAKQRQEAAQAAKTNERNLRQDLFTEARQLRKDLQEQAAAYEREIAAKQDAAATQQRDLELKLNTVRSQVMRSQTDIRELMIQIYQMNTYWGEVHRIAMLLYPVEWTQILAQVRVPKPEWQTRPPDQLPPAPNEGDSNA